ncbi:MAG: winged helix-turn-helix transcriptional regulator [Oscillospiraceae bacterium]|nr:winged helix-turn-helix transcriptional regulator [Oscillospiraceae bacterium]
MSQIIRDITEIARCGAQYRTEALAPMGLKACHASYLTEICAHPGISQDQLAGRICINKSNVARQAAVLEEEGFIKRIPSTTDKRIMELHPTQKTLDLMPQISPILRCWENCLTTDLTPEEVAVLQKLLIQMREKASAWMENH